ncbi:kinesin-like protein KIF19 [Haliotis cracherodii]|uniref:kinesin-like protein KIF19 n=1 Tax=Haliotis cracherodii TaxID=6455 RepID=UPI0039EAE8E6
MSRRQQAAVPPPATPGPDPTGGRDSGGEGGSMNDSRTKGGGEQTLTVACRIRPMSEDEIMQGASPIAYKVEESMVVLLDPLDDPDDILRQNRSREKQFVFDTTFDGSATQKMVYEATTKILIPNVVTGYNATVFAYGATGAGKTHTMLGTDKEPGIMVLTLNDLFQEMEKTSNNMAYKVSMSYLEIYNEMIRDLLNPSSGILDLREDSRGQVQVAGLSEVTARSTDEVIQMLMKGNQERTQEPTAANKTSSRSHAVLQVIVKQRNRVRNTMQEVRTGKLFLIDLAGSERAANTHNRGKRMVEGAHINRSLLALGNCINALSDKNGPKYINYRDSKLTRLLKDALGGNCKTVMIAHISPASLHFEESRNTLVYADRAKHIKTKVRRNVTDVAYHIAQYTNIISELRDEILKLRSRLQDQGTGSRTHANIQAVQSEVLEARRHADRDEITKLREQLLTCFKDQMELRKTLMELNNASMEISLETNRNQLVISEWDVEKARGSKREDGDSTDNKYKDERDSKGNIIQPDEVRVARDELKVLHDEKHKTERVRSTVRRELETAKHKMKKLEEIIPQRIGDDDQQEILQLLCKVHELEIENLEVKSACLLRDFTIKKKDMIITRFRHHRNLCDEIIKQQRQLITDHKVPCPKELEDLYHLYTVEKEDKVLYGDDSDTPKPLSTGTRQVSSLTDIGGHDDDKFFTPSAKAKHLQGLSQIWTGSQYMENLNSSSAIYHPVTASRQSFDDKEVIQSNTRNIAALAAKKRTKAHHDHLNAERQGHGSRPLYRPSHDSDAGALTPSRLAKHNRTYGDGMTHTSTPPSDDNISSVTVEKLSIHTDISLPVISASEERYRGGVRKVSRNEADQRRKKRGRNFDVVSSYSQQRLNSKKTTATNSNKYIGRNKGSDSSAVSTPQQQPRRDRKALPTIPGSYRKETIHVTGFHLPR